MGDPMPRLFRRAKGTEATWLARLVAAQLIAALGGGCAEQPSALPGASNSDWKTASSAADGQWTTQFYRG